MDVSISDNTKLFFRYNFQAEKQPFPVGLWWRNANQVPYPTSVVADNRSHSATASLTKVFGSTLTSETTFGVTYISFPNRYEDPSKVSTSALGYNNPGIYKNGLDQIPAFTTWGQGPTMLNPGGFDPVLFANKWLTSVTQNVTKVAGAHTIKMGGYFEFVNNSQPGNDYSNGQLHLRDVDRQHDRQQLLGHPDRPRHQRLHRVDEERHPGRGVQGLRGLRAGQLQGQAARDTRVRRAPVVPGSVVRAQRHRHGGLRAGQVQPERRADRPDRHFLART